MAFFSPPKEIRELERGENPIKKVHNTVLVVPSDLACIKLIYGPLFLVLCIIIFLHSQKLLVLFYPYLLPTFLVVFSSRIFSYLDFTIYCFICPLLLSFIFIFFSILRLKIPPFFLVFPSQSYTYSHTYISFLQ